MGVLVIGINPYWRPDEAYTAFAAMAGRQLGVIMTDAVSYQNERKRQQALAELDRARTEFFQNVDSRAACSADHAAHSVAGHPR